MKILITGHKGFIGQNFAKHLTDHDLVFYDWLDTLPNIQGLDLVIHLGAITSTTENDINKLMVQNYEFSCWLFEQCGKFSVNLQYASSASVYGLSDKFCESQNPDPKSPYAWSKYLFERYVKTNCYKYPEITVQGFRYFNVYGPHEEHKGDQASPYHKFKTQATSTGTIMLFENSEHYKRDFVPVERVIDIHRKFFNLRKTGLWNLGTGHAKSFQEVAVAIAKETNAVIKYIPMPDNLKGQYQAYTCADLTLLNNTLSYE